MVAFPVVFKSWVGPIEGGVVEAGDDAFGTAAIDEFADDVFFVGGFGDIPGAEAVGVVEAEPIVVAGGEGDVFCAAGFGELGEFSAGEVGHFPGVHELHVFVARDFVEVHCPFALLEEGIEAVVDKDAEGEFFEVDDAVGRLVGLAGHEDVIRRVRGEGGLEELASCDTHGAMLLCFGGRGQGGS